MQGKTEGDTIIVIDAYALPVEGTETRVNAQEEGYEYMVAYARYWAVGAPWALFAEALALALCQGEGREAGFALLPARCSRDPERRGSPLESRRSLNKLAGRLENVVGWYHSHPGYGCWLSGIDVATQILNQTHQEPFLAVVVREREEEREKERIGAR